MLLQLLIAMMAGWVGRYQHQAISYLLEENRLLRTQLGSRRLRLTDIQRRRLAALAQPLGRQRLKEIATIATPDSSCAGTNHLPSHFVVKFQAIDIV